MPDPNEIPVPDPDKAGEIDRIIREGDETARRIMEQMAQEGSLEHGRAWLPERERAIGPESHPRHYAEAVRYAHQAAEALRSGEVTKAQALAAIGQIHATLAAAAAAALNEATGERLQMEMSAGALQSDAWLRSCPCPPGSGTTASRPRPTSSRMLPRLAELLTAFAR